MARRLAWVSHLFNCSVITTLLGLQLYIIYLYSLLQDLKSGPFPNSSWTLVNETESQLEPLKFHKNETQYLIQNQSLAKSDQAPEATVTYYLGNEFMYQPDAYELVTNWTRTFQHRWKIWERGNRKFRILFIDEYRMVINRNPYPC